MRIVTEHGGRLVEGDEAERVRRWAAAGVQATRILARQPRMRYATDRPDIKRAMRSVEARLVEALWTLHRLPQDRGPGAPRQHGLAYMQESADRWGIAVDNKGRWVQDAPRPGLPSGREIDAMPEALAWCRLLPKDRSRLLFAAAATKRGEVDRSVSWSRVRDALPEVEHLSRYTLGRRYEAALRTIVAALTWEAMQEAA